MKSHKVLVLLSLAIISKSMGQTTTFVPRQVETGKKYLFYLHGGIVQEQGINAVSDLFGPYEYLKILDTLESYGYHVISEARPKSTEEVAYALKVSLQVDTLLNLGVSPENIVIVGASLGAYITIEIANVLKNSEIRYILIGLCSDYALSFFSKYRNELCGDFLSIYEGSDQKGSCSKILDNPYCKSGYKEIKLAMGNGHGFLYQPYKEWVHPLVAWIN